MGRRRQRRHRRRGAGRGARCHDALSHLRRPCASGMRRAASTTTAGSADDASFAVYSTPGGALRDRQGDRLSQRRERPRAALQGQASASARSGSTRTGSRQIKRVLAERHFTVGGREVHAFSFPAKPPYRVEIHVDSDVQAFRLRQLGRARARRAGRAPVRQRGALRRLPQRRALSRSGCLRTKRRMPRQCQSVRRVRSRRSVTAWCACSTTASGTYQRSQPAFAAR